METHFLFFFYCCIGLSLVFAEGAQMNNELSSLLSIKSVLVDPLGNLKDWRSPNGSVGTDGIVHCTWTGVVCSPSGFVEKLDLSYMNLSGRVSEHIQDLTSLASINLSGNLFDSSLPKYLPNLTSLRSIDVSMNNFIGQFPIGLGQARVLRELNASSNNFAGAIPEDLGNATLLESLDLRGNFFEGSVPASFENLQSLRFLGISGNNLTGRIPRELGRLSSLETIILGYNEFEGEIPSEFGNLSNLRYLDLAVGTLSGQIPAGLGKLQKLTTVYLYDNNFLGIIPPEIGNMSSLVFLDLSANQISGEIPESIGDLKNLELLNLMCNRLTGSVPTQLEELTNLQVLALWKNSLTGILPPNLGNKSPLQWLDVSSNSLSGKIPKGLCNSGNLTKLILFNNSFSGTIPLGLSGCNSLVRVRVQHNLISGPIPNGFGTLPGLQRLELAYNNVSGQIPQDFFLSPSLSFIDLSHNQLQSSIPSGIFSLPSLQTFIASNNKLDGKIPDEFQDCPSLALLDLSSNGFLGSIPDSIASCRKLVKLDLKNNHFDGEIPKSLAAMPTLAILNLSNNSFAGQIPENFGSSPALESLNLSYNKLVGQVPSMGILTNINPNELVGNPGLCGGVLPPCLQKSSSWSRQQKGMHVYHIIVGFAIGTSVILCFGLTFFVGKFLYRRWYLYDTNYFYGRWFKKGTEEWPWRLVAFQRVCFTSGDILGCINESNIIGMGGTGMVYKAEIHRPHVVVAVKKLWRSGSDIENGEDLLREVNLLGRLRHRNIVRLLGYVHNESDAMMVYEYMPNGNLGTALHGKQAGKLLVDWVSRYNVAVGVAQGLNYLHNDCYPPVIHRDIKSNNILLDANLGARIADFGLARMMIHKNETVSMVAGSYGYIAPEYGYTLKVDEKSDIYSFGVVLLELLTGKMPLDPGFGESTDIVEWVRTNIRDNKAVEEVLDPSIAGQCKLVQEEMLLVLRIALLCTAKLPKDRPSMRDVLMMLGEAKPRRKSVCYNNNNDGQNVAKDRPVFSTSPVIGLL
ncbi:leucine-rich repeat receptor-like protein kinase PXL1 [Punica granatum]|uniref:non-specific serine/threonine protein kinase n=2 Tax=Punica granatum TaxID=22663 RepID=A0A218WH36_PUNGR|nr:leucine-rich repeat receptor-like protein kinase PXL1 [Punica granatum]OWM71660.1 hypothetical protein CDL15_Pgr005848 [Punica granatum]PKI41375.1 hypothetical protein CRG98_038261 [Punica granatum]